MSVTVIRHKLTAAGFAVVVTGFERGAFVAYVQEYKTAPDNGGRTSYHTGDVYSAEAGAIEVFNKIN